MNALHLLRAATEPPVTPNGNNSVYKNPVDLHRAAVAAVTAAMHGMLQVTVNGTAVMLSVAQGSRIRCTATTPSGRRDMEFKPSDYAPDMLMYTVEGRAPACTVPRQYRLQAGTPKQYLAALVRFALVRLAQGVTAATEPTPDSGIVAVFRELQRKLPATNPDKYPREMRRIRFAGLDVVALSHAGDSTVRLHVLEDNRDTCAFAEIPYAPKLAPAVQVELQGRRGVARHRITSARDYRDLLAQMLVWVTTQYKSNQHQLQNFKAAP